MSAPTRPNPPPIDVRATARAARAAGISVCPSAEDGTKRPKPDLPDAKTPYDWKALSESPVSDEVFSRWYGKRAGLGFVCGSVSGGLECFEFDDGPTYDRFRELAQEVGLGDLVERIEAGYLERTPGGGVHWLYFTAEVRGNTPLAKRPVPTDTNPHATKPLIETRGEGGFVVVAPSCGKVHKTGNPYVLDRGGVGSIVTLDGPERDALWDLARSFDEMPKPKPVEPTPARRGRPDDLRPGDDFEQRRTWDSILEPANWKPIFTRGDTTYWRRPGKSIGTSATTNHGGSGFLWVFSSSTTFESLRSYTKFGAYALLHHEGVHGAAAKALRIDGYGGRSTSTTRRSPKAEALNGHAGGDDKPPDDSTGAQPSGRDRPTIIIGVDQHRVIDECEAALALEPNLYCRATGLVRILSSEGGRKKHDPDRPPGTPLIAAVEEPTLSEILSKHAKFVRPVKDRNGDDLKPRPDHPPRWAVAALRHRGTYPSIRSLEGIIETPTIRRDGSILDAPGWDEETGLLFLPGTTFGPIPDRPSLVDAQAAAAVLLDLVCDVPFKDRRHSAAWLAALLTVIARHAVDGPTPLFIFDANLRSVGKSLLCDLLYAIAAGREMPRKTYPEDDAEMRKVITSIALAGDAVTMFDNLASGGMVGGRIIDNILTSTTWKDRLLATNREPVLNWRSVLFATGNNLQIHADTFSRSCRSRIESDEMRPEERRNFKVQGCLIKHTMERRAELVRAALTILRAHALAGRPGDAELPRIRTNFRSWSDVIRCAVYWSTGVDPCEIQEDERGIDQDATAAEALVAGWLKLCQSEDKTALPVSAALEAIERSGVQHAGLRELLMSWSRDNKLPSSKTVGKRLGQFSKRPTSVGTLQPTPPRSGIIAWYVKPAAMHDASGFSGSSGFGSNPSPVDSADNCHTSPSGNDGKQTHQSHQTHYGQDVEL